MASQPWAHATPAGVAPMAASCADRDARWNDAVCSGDDGEGDAELLRLDAMGTRWQRSRGSCELAQPSMVDMAGVQRASGKKSAEAGRGRGARGRVGETAERR